MNKPEMKVLGYTDSKGVAYDFSNINAIPKLVLVELIQEQHRDIINSGDRHIKEMRSLNNKSLIIFTLLMIIIAISNL